MDVDAVWIPVWILVGILDILYFGIYLDCGKRLDVGLGLGLDLGFGVCCGVWTCLDGKISCYLLVDLRNDNL